MRHPSHPADRFDVGENGAITLDYVGASWGYPNGTIAERATIVDDHVA